jgi:hypothetical protein
MATAHHSPVTYHRLRLPTAEERDRLADYLSLGGWDVEPSGRRDLRARWKDADGRERMNLRFSVAVWRVMNR